VVVITNKRLRKRTVAKVKYEDRIERGESVSEEAELFPIEDILNAIRGDL